MSRIKKRGLKGVFSGLFSEGVDKMIFILGRGDKNTRVVMEQNNKKGRQPEDRCGQIIKFALNNKRLTRINA